METTAEPRVTLAELVAMMSIVSDLGMGRPVERVLRQTVIAMRLARLSGADDQVAAATYYTSLLTWVGCATDTSDLATLFGDETDLYADTHDGDLAGATMGMFIARHLGRGGSPVRRIGLVGQFLLTAGRSVQSVMEAHCRSAGELADRLGLGDHVREPLLQAFERWDGRGVPGARGGADLAESIRVVHLADNVEAFYDAGGADAAIAVAQQRRATQFDPDLVDLFCDHAAEILDGIGDLAAWDEVIALEPRLGEALPSEQLDSALRALGDFADLKSPLLTGHSSSVAELAAQAGGQLGLPGADVATIRRAAWIHDIGIIGVPSGVWDEPGSWSLGQRERARTHPYLGERMLSGVPQLGAIARCAALHHERLDGSGYPRGCTADAIPIGARVLAAADVYRALREPRPHRPAVDTDEAEQILRAEVTAGHLDGDATNEVLRAAGHRVRRRAELPGGLTRREVEVLVQLARGRSNPQIAAELHVSRKTVSTHLEHIYAKLGVTTRTDAALFAMRHGLIAEPGEG